MTEPVTLDSGLPILVTFALKNCKALYDKVQSIQPKPRPIVNLKTKLQALTSALDLLTATVRAGTDPDLSVLKLPLQQCGLELLPLFAGRFNQILSAKSEGLQRDMKTPGILARPQADKDVNFSTIGKGNATTIVSTRGKLIHSVNSDEKEDGTKAVDSSSNPQFHSKNDAPPPHSKGKPIPESLQNTQTLPVIPPILLEPLLQQDEQRRADTLSALFDEPPSTELQAYFDRLCKGSETWTTSALTEGFMRFFGNLCGPGRDKFYDNPVMGLQSRSSFVERWNQRYPQLPITPWDENIRRPCPPSWSSELRGKHLHWVSTYQGDKPLSQGMNEYIQGPVTADCGMVCEFAPWFAIRWVTGDDWFDKMVKFEKGEFIITQVWQLPMNDDGTEGNLLNPFYDNPRTTDPLESQARIQTRTIHNHSRYTDKHPGGESRLENVFRIDGNNMTFSPSAPRNVFTDVELEQTLLQKYNAPQDFADSERLWRYKRSPDDVHPHSAPKSNRVLVEEAEKLAGHILDDTAWNDSKHLRYWNARECHLIFNDERLIKCLEETKDAHLSGSIDEDILSRARKMKLLDEIRSMLIPVSEVEAWSKKC